MTFIFQLPVEPTLMGNNWKDLCQVCQFEEAECCREIELTLFPDEIAPFKSTDPEKLVYYSQKIAMDAKTQKSVQYWGYNAARCCFLTNDNLCALQLKGLKKPVDCMLYPVNYKNQKLYLDTSCRAQHLTNINAAIQLLEDKLTQYPDYIEIKYKVMPTDLEIGNIVLLKSPRSDKSRFKIVLSETPPYGA